MKTSMAYSKRWLVGAISTIVLSLFVFSWFLRRHMENVGGRSCLAIGALVLLSAITVTIWLRFRRLPLMRPWLVRHVAGNFVLAIGLIAAWSFDLGLAYYAAIVVGVFVMWTLGTWKLRDTVQKNREETSTNLPE